MAWNFTSFKYQGRWIRSPTFLSSYTVKINTSSSLPFSCWLRMDTSHLDWSDIYCSEIEGRTRSILTHTLSFALSFCPGATFPEPGGVQQSWQVWEPDRGLASENPVREARIQFGYVRHSQQNQTYQKWTSKLSLPMVKLYFAAIHLCN